MDWMKGRWYWDRLMGSMMEKQMDFWRESEWGWKEKELV
jgi:hypothetical protein